MIVGPSPSESEARIEVTEDGECLKMTGWLVNMEGEPLSEEAYRRAFLAALDWIRDKVLTGEVDPGLNEIRYQPMN